MQKTGPDPDFERKGPHVKPTFHTEGPLAGTRRLSKTYRLVTAVVLFWLPWLALTAKAQEPTYSANSLIATFENGSRTSPKGQEIVLRDVVAETRTSKVIFKSSQSDRVICELGPSTQHDKQPNLGTTLTVKGRVRGRGLLGNVTLDDCSIAPIEEPVATPEIVPQEVAPAEPEAVAEAVETLPAAAPPVSEHARSIPRQPQTPPAVAPRATFAPDRIEQISSVQARADHPEDSTQPDSDSQPHVPYAFYALLVLSGAIGSLILSKLLTPATRVSRPPLQENTPQMRQTALQELLLKAEKKK